MKLTKPFVVPQAYASTAGATPLVVSLTPGNYRIKIRGALEWLHGSTGQIRLEMGGTVELTGGYVAEAWNSNGSSQNDFGQNLFGLNLSPWPDGGNPARTQITLDALVNVTVAGDLVLLVSAPSWNAADAVFLDKDFAMLALVE